MSFLRAYLETSKPSFSAAAQRALYSSRVKRSLRTTFRLSFAAFVGLPRFFMALLSYVNSDLSSPMLLDKPLNVGQSKPQRPAFGQAHAWQLPGAHLAANGDLAHVEQSCYFRNS
jgi:hypothetical protein